MVSCQRQEAQLLVWLCLCAFSTQLVLPIPVPPPNAPLSLPTSTQPAVPNAAVTSHCVCNGSVVCAVAFILFLLGLVPILIVIQSSDQADPGWFDCVPVQTFNFKTFILSTFKVSGWKFGLTICQFYLTVDYTASTASIFNLFILSLDRFALLFLLYLSVNKQKSKMQICWVLI